MDSELAEDDVSGFFFAGGGVDREAGEGGEEGADCLEDGEEGGDEGGYCRGERFGSVSVSISISWGYIRTLLENSVS